MSQHRPAVMEPKVRKKICRLYGHYVAEWYTDVFNSQHVPPDVIAHLAKELVSYFPSLTDPDCDPDSPTRVSENITTLDTNISNPSSSGR